MERLTLSEIPGDQESKYGSIDDDDSADSNDGLYEEAVAIVRRQGKASTSLIQRHLRIGYNRAARIIERMESEGLIGKQDGSKPRPLLKGNRNHEQED
jgi:S-DNA-T family DNA segregation ATPase FtsK/SpoIIIE